ncbi:MAG: RnfABCDGE type electron transport complex subunit D [Planctomycetota bacterium]|nr:MAG: RnfABCDGE type electron transport complex subunit D [Planctomycetota bacterium]
MSDNQVIPLPEPGSLRSGASPYWRGVPGVVPIAATFLLAASIVIISGLILFGWNTLRVLAISVAVALLVESTFSLLTRRTRSWSEAYALLVGVLFACTLPPTVNWHVPVVGAAFAIMLGQVLPGGVGNYIWHPVVLGRIAVQILFHDQVTPKWSSVLAPGHLLWGNLDGGQELSTLGSWGSYPVSQDVQTLLSVPPAEHLRLPIITESGVSNGEMIAGLVRDILPPWPDTLFGVVGGGIGEACVIAVIVAGLLLLWRGFLRWPMVVAAIVSAVVLTAMLPVRILLADGTMATRWFPGLAGWEGLPVGLVYVCYHLTAGEFLLVLLLLAPDPSSSPLTSRGHAWFGFIIGVVTIMLRVLMGMPASGYWALIIANTMVGVINRTTKRRIFGTWRVKPVY